MGITGAGAAPTVFLLDPMGFGAPVLSGLTVSGDRATIDIGAFTFGGNLSFDWHYPGFWRWYLNYEMEARVGGPGLLSSGGRATLGDPFNSSGDYGAGIVFTNAAESVPEPSTIVLLATALGALGAMRWRQGRLGRTDGDGAGPSN